MWFSSFLVLYKMLWMTKKSSREDQVKTFAENFLNSKVDKFYLKGVNKLSENYKKWFKNSGAYTIGLKSLLNYLWINDILS